jgi:adenosylmethionine-8-amino-7-oxononanoate aminotransferase
MDSATLKEWDKRYLWHPFTQMQDWQEEEPIVIVKGQGVWLFDSDGNRYLDGVAAMWTNVHGHSRPEINAAISAQLERIEHSTLLGLSNEPAILLAKRIMDLAPAGLTRLFYSDNGSTAMEVAVKMAFQYQQHRGKPEKKGFIRLSHAYHGDTLGAVSVGSIDIYHSTFRHLLFPTMEAPAPYCYRCPLGMKDPANCGMACLGELERLMVDNSGSIAAMVMEPLVQGAGGMIVHPAGYLKGVRQLCDRHDILLVTDEVAVGFGRTGTMFACQQEGVVPDIMALAKGITAGYLPLAATLATDEIYNAFLGDYRELKTFFHGHTFTGNPLACAAGLASLDLFTSDRLLEQLPAKIDYLKGRLESLAQFPHVGDARQRGMIAGIELVRDKESREPYPWEERLGIRVCREARNHGLFLRPLGNVIVIFPPLAITLNELSLLMDGVEASIQSVTGI